MKSLIQKSFVSTGLVLASLALGGHAMAATAHVKARTTPPAASWQGVDVAAIPPYPNYTDAVGPNPQRNARSNAAARPAYRYPAGGHFGAEPGINVGQLIGGMLGMVPPQYAGIVQSAMKQAASHRSYGTSSGGYDPTFDSPSPSTPIDNSASDAAAASAAAASEQNLNDEMALTASMAAAEQQNDAANAAALQTEINAGN
ncbi:MAG: hypothetical protein ABSE50_03455 [Xanthobacteraceae bacterium]|jgi:hypothetical protein